MNQPAILVAPTADTAEAVVAEHCIAAIAAHPRIVLGLATGRTMVGVYDKIVAGCARASLSLAGVTTFNLDEYCGLPEGHPASFRAYMRRHLIDRTDIDPARSHVPIGIDGAGYERLIAMAGGIDLQLLGIGRNGHIGFNEPGSAITSRTRIVTLAPTTLEDNRDAFDGCAPREAMTMGIATILGAREIVLLATGPAKAEALADAFGGPVRAGNPASALQRHPRVTVVCDADAAARLDPALRQIAATP
ncbi:glucosamine-6-phosphate deaminase [Acuticoccus kandeliae]|uniref:glucosamine-6-phosphate deaminase n=1 Tax=Acuticoccus kandeliae TaxID=2073160 RepID=UPI000D3ED40B|nr:glucosamine-6-phosphate deaminase [Acuticoccus kandeliae]